MLNVADAENILVTNTQAVVEALRLRAKAAAATKLASEKYEEAIIKRNEAETRGGVYNKKGKLIRTDKREPSLLDKALSFGTGLLTGAFLRVRVQPTEESIRDYRIKQLDKESKAAEKDADAYFDLAAGYEASATAELKAAGISAAHKYKKEKVTRTKKRT